MGGDRDPIRVGLRMDRFQVRVMLGLEPIAPPPFANSAFWLSVIA